MNFVEDSESDSMPPSQSMAPPPRRTRQKSTFTSQTTSLSTTNTASAQTGASPNPPIMAPQAPSGEQASARRSSRSKKATTKFGEPIEESLPKSTNNADAKTQQSTFKAAMNGTIEDSESESANPHHSIILRSAPKVSSAPQKATKKSTTGKTAVVPKTIKPVKHRIDDSENEASSDVEVPPVALELSKSKSQVIEDFNVEANDSTELQTPGRSSRHVSNVSSTSPSLSRTAQHLPAIASASANAKQSPHTRYDSANRSSSIASVAPKPRKKRSSSTLAKVVAINLSFSEEAPEDKSTLVFQYLSSSISKQRKSFSAVSGAVRPAKKRKIAKSKKVIAGLTKASGPYLRWLQSHVQPATDDKPFMVDVTVKKMREQQMLTLFNCDALDPEDSVVAKNKSQIPTTMKSRGNKRKAEDLPSQSRKTRKKDATNIEDASAAESKSQVPTTKTRNNKRKAEDLAAPPRKSRKKDDTNDVKASALNMPRKTSTKTKPRLSKQPVPPAKPDASDIPIPSIEALVPNNLPVPSLGAPISGIPLKRKIKPNFKYVVTDEINASVKPKSRTKATAQIPQLLQIKPAVTGGATRTKSVKAAKPAPKPRESKGKDKEKEQVLEQFALVPPHIRQEAEDEAGDEFQYPPYDLQDPDGELHASSSVTMIPGLKLGEQFQDIRHVDDDGELQVEWRPATKPRGKTTKPAISPTTSELAEALLAAAA